MRRHLTLVLLAASLPLLGAPPAPAGGYGTLRGMVFDGAKVVPGAVARVGNGRLTAQSDKSGIFTIRVPAGSYRVEVSAAGYKADVQTVEVTAGRIKDIAALLERAAGRAVAQGAAP